MSDLNGPNLTQSMCFLANADQWPQFDGYTALLQDAERTQIRVLELSYDGQNKKVQCTLVHHDLENDSPSNPYFALSYYWGAPGEQKPITLNGIQVHLRKTVYDFLKALGSRFGRIRVWLDILCINQKDVGERSQQISLMHKIYSQSKAVYTWLGKGNADTDLLFNALSFAGKHELAKLGLGQQIAAPKLLSYAQNLLAHPYFTRVWIIQECAMARKLYVICGSRMMERYQLIDGIRKMEKSAVAAQSKTSKEVYLDKKLLRQTTRILLTQHTNGTERSSLLDLIERFSTARCEDAKDKMYGLRGLAMERDAIQVEYSRGILYTIFSTLKSIRQLRHESSLAFYCHGVVTLLRHVPFSVGDVLSGLTELHWNAYGDTNQRRPTQDRSLESPINGFVFSSGANLITTDTQFLAEAGYFCTRCVFVANPEQASYLYCKLPPAIGCLVYAQYGIPSSSECLAIVIGQGLGNEGGVVEIGVLIEETSYQKIQFEKLTSLQESHSSVHAYKFFFFREAAWVESWSRFRNLCLPGGFEVCVMHGNLHTSPIVLLAIAIWQYYGWHEQIWTAEEAGQVLEMIEGWVEGNADIYRRQRLCCCFTGHGMTKQE